ncbi:MAG: sigma-70 family RNA polymerase sigma factor [Verrucomicrobia bacterium]|nr:sigma-70 family RNA polymerase sigma factor [Verrucomicrobiota bacterium]
MSDTDLQLLDRYSRHRAEDAFTELVRRHLDLVHSAALRQVRSPQLAEEVAQTVFTDLARQARQLAPDTIVPAWLYEVTRRTAIDVVRREARRQLREQVATEMNAMNANAADWSQIEPLLDEAMHALDATDRAAVLLRYFENKSLREVGAALGTSDDAAQKRVSRAVERLREFFAKRGVAVGASGLAVVLSANAVQAAPAGLALTISTAVTLTGTAIVTATAATKFIAVTALQKVIASLTVITVVGLATLLMVQRQGMKMLDSENQALRQVVTQTRLDHVAVSNRAYVASESVTRLESQVSELLRLRAEVTLLRAQSNELVRLRLENANLLSQLGKDIEGGSLVADRRASWFQIRLAYKTPQPNTQQVTNSVKTRDGGLVALNRFLHPEAVVDGRMVKSAEVNFNPVTGKQDVFVRFNDEGKQRLAAFTRENVKQEIAVMVDGQLCMMPIINAEIPGGAILISGDFSEAQATEMARKLNDGVAANLAK